VPGCLLAQLGCGQGLFADFKGTKE